MDILVNSSGKYKWYEYNFFTALVVNVNQKEPFILQQDLSFRALSLTRMIPIPSLTSNIDQRMYFVTKPHGKISKFPTTQTRNHSKQTAARCYVSI